MSNDSNNSEKIQELFKKLSKLKNSSKLVSKRIFDDKQKNRINSCADFLLLERWQSKFDLNDIKRRVKQTNLCRSKVCDFCNFLKARKIGNQLYNIMLNLHDKVYEFSFLTLSAKNCDIDKLDEEVKYLNHSWHKLTRKKFFKPFEYWFKALEFTYNEKEKSFNPHFHIILAYIPTGYFKTSRYVSQEQWMDEWQHALQCDYPPTANIRKIKPKNKTTNSIISAVAEVSKYPFKSCNVSKLSNEQFNDVFFRQLKNTRFFTTSRNIKINDDIEKEEYINQETYRLLDIEIYKHFSRKYNIIKTIKNETV